MLSGFHPVAGPPAHQSKSSIAMAMALVIVCRNERSNMAFVRLAAVLVLCWGHCHAFQPGYAPASSTARRISRRITVRRGSSAAAHRPRCRAASNVLPLDMSSANSDGEGETERLRRAASKLRAEVEELEKSRGIVAASSTGEADYVKPTQYSDLKDSCWEMT